MNCFRKRKGYNFVKNDVEVELIDETPRIQNLVSCEFLDSKYKRVAGSDVDNIKFREDRLDFGNGLVCKYEYIANYLANHNIIIMTTFTDYDEFGIKKCDKLSYIYLVFDTFEPVCEFKELFEKKVLEYGSKNKFDKTVRHLNVFKKFFKL